MGFEDEAEQSFGRPCRQTDSRFKRTHELTSSIVPRGSSFHRSAELEFSPIASDPARLSCRRDFFPCPPEFGAVNPQAVHDNCHSPCHGDDRPLHSPMSGDLHAPGLEPRPLDGAGQHALCRFEQHGTHHGIPAFRDATHPVDLARLMLRVRLRMYFNVRCV